MATALRHVTVPALAAIPGLVHGFEQRLDAALHTETRDESRRRVAAALAPVGPLLLLKQVHGAVVHRAPWDGARPEGDAALCARPGVVVGIETADCLPVLVVDPARRLAAAAHAGWRGTVAGVAAAAVRALVAEGSRVDDLVAALGPSIGVCCYEVGDELRPQFAAAFPGESDEFFRPGPLGRAHLDVRAANVRQLERAGLSRARIQQIAECTYCRPDLYHSYRREGPGGGRMINFIGWER